MPLAPAATLPARAGGHIAEVLALHNVPQRLVADEVERMREHRIAATANRSVVGVMVEFTHLANIHRDRELDPDLLDLAARLARTPCSPLYGSNASPDRGLAARIRTGPRSRNRGIAVNAGRSSAARIRTDRIGAIH